MKYLTIHNNHSIQIGHENLDCWRFQDVRTSEIFDRQDQCPANVDNLVKFIISERSDWDDKSLAGQLILDQINSIQHVYHALHYKASSEKLLKDKPHCGVFETRKYLEVIPNPDPILAAFGAPPVEVQKEEKLEILKEYRKYSDGYEPFSQQLIGCDFIMKMKRCAILYDMRVGKTLTALMAAKCALERKEVDKIIIVSPRIVMKTVWESELDNQNLTFYTLENGRDLDEANLSHQDADCYLSSYESLVQRLDLIQDSMDLSRTFVICDETSRIKNPSAKRTKAVFALTYKPRYVVFLTGTPMEQGPHDIWAQMFAIDRGIRLKSTFANFENWYLRKERNKYYVIPQKKVEMELAIQSLSLRYLRSEADQFSGKDKNFRYIQLSPSEEQIRATDDILNGIVNQFSEAEENYQEIKDVILVVYGYLREICCGYNKIELEYGSGVYSRFRFSYDPKTLWLETFLESNPGVPVVLFTEFDEQEGIIADMLDRIKTEYVWMKRDMNRLGPAECIRRFGEGDVRVIMMKTASAEGINLNRIPAVSNGIGSYPVIIYMAPTWALGRFTQSQDRCVGVDKDSGKNICTPIYMLSIKNGIEEKIIYALRHKKKIEETLLKDLERKGFYSFVDELRLKPDEAARDEVFDAEEMYARKILGISPEKKCKHSYIFKACPEAKEYVNSNKQLPDIVISQDQPQYLRDKRNRVKFALYLLQKFDESGNSVKTKTRAKKKESVSTVENFDEGFGK